MTKRAYDFEVQGRYPFPCDMLRYDRCCPVRSEDAAAIYDSISERGQQSLNTYTVRLRIYAVSGVTQPTEQRWRSFGWSVVPGSLRIAT